MKPNTHKCTLRTTRTQQEENRGREGYIVSWDHHPFRNHFQMHSQFIVCQESITNPAYIHAHSITHILNHDCFERIYSTHCTTINAEQES